ncbi:hypothetical protein [Bacillus sp. EAC]|uniref:hypothetical protein n=1 Tax=Bacillus sp. EAC TaxID=1978338 RepID=UPI000B4508D6|nr:hypothetical protein [Bacillus sp. EAC]
MKRMFDYLLIKIKMLSEEGIFLPYTMLVLNILFVFFIIQIDIIHSIHSFSNYSSIQNRLERAHSQAVYDLKKGDIPLQSNLIKYYNNTKIIWTFNETSKDEYKVTLTSSNSKIKNHIVQFNYLKGENLITNWTD